MLLGRSPPSRLSLTTSTETTVLQPSSPMSMVSLPVVWMAWPWRPSRHCKDKSKTAAAGLHSPWMRPASPKPRTWRERKVRGQETIPALVPRIRTRRNLRRSRSMTMMPKPQCVVMTNHTSLYSNSWMILRRASSDQRLRFWRSCLAHRDLPTLARAGCNITSLCWWTMLLSSRIGRHVL